jgi:hypothetical protein
LKKSSVASNNGTGMAQAEFVYRGDKGQGKSRLGEENNKNVTKEENLLHRVLRKLG